MWQYNHYDELMHYGVLGMKWGVRRAEKKAAKKLAKAQKQWDKKAQRNLMKAYNEAADYANEVLIPKINAKYSKIIKTEDWRDDPNYGKYEKEYEDAFNKVYNQKLTDLIGERPS